MDKQTVEKLREEYAKISKRDFTKLFSSEFRIAEYDSVAPEKGYLWFWLCESEAAARARAAYYNADAEFKGQTLRYHLHKRMRNNRELTYGYGEFYVVERSADDPINFCVCESAELAIRLAAGCNARAEENRERSHYIAVRVDKTQIIELKED